MRPELRECRELALLFTRLGATTFGGPAAHIAVMEDEVVRRRAWMTREAFLDLVGATHLIPGPNSTELAMHVGYARARGPGLVVAGLCFILPAVLIVGALAWGYVAYGTLPAVTGILAGVKPVVLAVVAQALWSLGRSAVKSAMTLAIGVTALVALLFGVHELVVLAVAGLVAMVDERVTRGGRPDEVSLAVVAVQTGDIDHLIQRGNAARGAASGAASGAAAGLLGLGGATLWPLFLVFLKAGAFLFGSGYVLLAFLRADLVTRLGWLSEAQLLDAIAVGQFTPGPVFTTATFVGFVVSGWSGALVATVGVFLPAFVFVGLTAPVLARMRTSSTLRGLLDGVTVASLAMMAAILLPLGREALSSWSGVLLFAASLVALLRWRVNAAWLVFGGAVLGWALL